MQRADEPIAGHIRFRAPASFDAIPREPDAGPPQAFLTSSPVPDTSGQRRTTTAAIVPASNANPNAWYRRRVPVRRGRPGLTELSSLNLLASGAGPLFRCCAYSTWTVAIPCTWVPRAFRKTTRT